MKKLGTILEEAGVIDEIQLIRALSHQRKWRCRLGRSFVELGIVSEETIAKTVSQQLGIPYKEFDPQAAPQELLELIPQDFAQTKMFFPLGYQAVPEGNAVEIAMSDPTDEETLIKLERAVGIRISRVVARDSEIEKAVNDWERLKSVCRRSPNADELLESVKIKDEPQGEMFKPPRAEAEAEKEQETPAAPSLEEKLVETLPPPPPPPPQITKSPFPEASHEMSTEEILSVAGLPPIEEDFSSPEMKEQEEAESSEEPAARAEESAESGAGVMEDAEVLQRSPMWEETMPTEIPQTDSGADAVPLEDTAEVSPQASENQVIEHTQAWEHIMPGTDAGAVESRIEEPTPSPSLETPPAPEEAQVIDSEAQPPSSQSAADLVEEINQLKAQINLIRKEIKILKEALVKIKRGEI